MAYGEYCFSVYLDVYVQCCDTRSPTIGFHDPHKGFPPLISTEEHIVTPKDVGFIIIWKCISKLLRPWSTQVFK